jgi:hypothetical protein
MAATPLAPLDWLIIAVVLVTLFGACRRGLGRETLHTLLYLGTLAAGYVYIAARTPSSGTSAAVMVVNLAYYVVTVYVVTWGIMRVGAPIIMDGVPPGMRGRFWAGILCLVKLLVTVVGLNLWFAVHSVDAYPQRMAQLPPFVQDSTLVKLSDSITEDVYQWAGTKGWLKYTPSATSADNPLTEEEEKTRQKLEEQTTPPLPIDPLP